MKCIIFTEERWGHFGFVMQLAQELLMHNIIPSFAFNIPPALDRIKTIKHHGFELIHNQGMIPYMTRKLPPVDFYLKSIEQCCKLLNEYQPDFILIDTVMYARLSGRLLNIPVFEIKRNNCTDLIYSFKELFQALTELYGRKTATAICVADKYYIPHPKDFLCVYDANVEYFTIKNNGIGNAPINGICNYQLIFIMSTSEKNDLLFRTILSSIKNENIFKQKNVLLIYPFLSQKDEMYPEYLTVLKWANLDKLLESVELIISMGGHGMCMRALEAGIPHIIIDINETHCFQYGDAVKRRRIGEFMASPLYDKAIIAQTVEHIYNNYSYYKKNCAIMAMIYRNTPSLSNFLFSV